MNLPRTWQFSATIGLLLVLLGFVAIRQNIAASPPIVDAKKAMDDGNFQEALEAYRQRLASPDTSGRDLHRVLPRAVTCLQRLNRVNEFDALIESAVGAHEDDWRLLVAAARAYQRAMHYGHMIAGEFERGPHRGGGKVVNAAERDRSRALQLIRRALELAEADTQASGPEKARVAQQLAGASCSISANVGPLGSYKR